MHKTNFFVVFTFALRLYRKELNKQRYRFISEMKWFIKG